MREIKGSRGETCRVRKLGKIIIALSYIFMYVYVYIYIYIYVYIHAFIFVYMYKEKHIRQESPYTTTCIHTYINICTCTYKIYRCMKYIDISGKKSSNKIRLAPLYVFIKI